MTATMTVLELGAGKLLIHSAIPLTDERRAAVEALGTVAHLYVPNTYHDSWVAAWAAAYPSARVHVPAGLARRRPELRADRIHGAAIDPDLDGVIDELAIAGFRLEETVLLHRPSRTLVVADLVHAIGRPPGWWTGVYTRLMGFWDTVALSRAIRVLGFSDRRAARRSIDAVLEQPF
ncbi:MAG: hypothetical protein KC457_05125, partial [Myxococcales bacterium]|nr:hypothetical protein [Myxococcales bacterium]